MNKILKRAICLIISAFTFLDIVNAVSVVVENGQAYSNEKTKSVEMKVSGTDLVDYTKLEFSLSLSGIDNTDSTKAEIHSVSYNGIKSGTSFSITEIGWCIENESNLEEEMVFTINYITYETEDDFTITPVNIWLYKNGEEPQALSAESIKSGTIKYLAPVSTDASLESLTISDGIKEYPLNPEFDKEIKNYTINAGESTTYVNISVKTADKASAEGYGRKTLTPGKNEFKVKVTAEDKTTTKEYTITIYRGDVIEPSPYLSNIKINTEDCTMSPRFDKMNNKYTIDAPFGTESLEIEYTSEDKNAKVEITGNEDLTEGENTITIKVTSSDELETETYELVVNIDKENKTKPAAPLDPEPLDTQKPGVLIIGSIVLTILLIIVIIGFLLFKKKRHKKKKVVEEENISDNDRKVQAYFDDEKTSTYDINSFREVHTDAEIEKTKEYHFNFKD